MRLEFKHHHILKHTQNTLKQQKKPLWSVLLPSFWTLNSCSFASLPAVHWNWNGWWCGGGWFAPRWRPCERFLPAAWQGKQRIDSRCNWKHLWLYGFIFFIYVFFRINEMSDSSRMIFFVVFAYHRILYSSQDSRCFAYQVFGFTFPFRGFNNLTSFHAGTLGRHWKL